MRLQNNIYEQKVAFERGKPGETNTNLDDSLDGKDGKGDATE